MSIKFQLGEKMPPAKAKAVVDELYRKVAERWEVKVNRTPFMMRLIEGKLPLNVLRVFFRKAFPDIPIEYSGGRGGENTIRTSLEKLGVPLGKIG